MKYLVLPMLLLGLAAPCHAADEMINPANYICAELVAANVDGEPPIFEGLQLDGYYSGQKNLPYADASILGDMLIEVADSCSAKPADKALAHWEMARKNHPAENSAIWNANTYTCADYAANPDDGSGFVIWLDAWNRAKTGKTASVLSSQEAIDNFLELCKANPQRIMRDVINENGR